MSTSSSKESKEVREKKRVKKSSKTESRSGSPESKKSRDSSSEDTRMSARSLFYLEERSVEGRDMAKDVTIYKQSCDRLRDVMTQIAALKGKQDAESKTQVEQLRKKGILEFVVLKRMNRMARFGCKAVREVTSEAKQQIDKHHLRLQNLLYEIMHLQREITKCLDFKSHDEDINLVEVEEFYQEAPEDIAKPEMTKKDLHQQTLARLDWELEQRKRLSDKLHGSQETKDSLKKEIQSKQGYLDSLQPKLNDILQATKPVQEHLNMKFDEIREQHRSASYLPRPLYVLYMQASAYRDACDKYIEVSIQGDLDVAKALGQSTTAQEEESDSENEEQEKGGDTSKRRRHSTRAGPPSDGRQERVLRQHPLSVHLTVTCKDGSVLFLKLHYLLALEIVTVHVSLTPPQDMPANTQTAGDLLSADNLLSCLYADDYGRETPNSANTYALQRAGISSLGSFTSTLGLPYRWLQCMCGLQFLSEHEKKTSDETRAMNESNLDCTVRRLRRRVRARLSLYRQLTAFEKGSVSVLSEFQHLFPTKISSSLASWKRSTYEDFVGCAYTQHVVQGGLANENDMYFSATVERGSARLWAQVLVTPDYPHEAPVLALCVQWRSQRTALTDQHVREMEAEVNIHYGELLGNKSHDQLLTNQLQRLLMCFDVYVETESENAPIEGPVEFAKERIFTKNTRGPQRSKPFKYSGQLGIFQQR